MNKYFISIMDTLMDSVLSMESKIFDKLLDECEETLESKGKIIISGLGKNVPICEKFVGTMLSLGLEANFMHTNTAVHGDLGMVKKQDIVLLLSKSGETVETSYLVERLLERNSKIWLVTFNNQASLISKVHEALVLSLKDEGDLWNLVPNNSSTVNLIILQGLAIELCKRKKVQLSEFKQNHPGGHIGEILNNV